MSDKTNNVLPDEESMESSHQEPNALDMKGRYQRDIDSRFQREWMPIEPRESTESTESVDTAHKLNQDFMREVIETKRALRRSRIAAQFSQIVDYCFYIIYAFIGLQFTLRLMSARPGNAFVQFIAGVSWLFLASFERIIGTPSIGEFQLQLSYLLAFAVYVLLHIAINRMLRIIAYPKVALLSR